MCCSILIIQYKSRSSLPIRRSHSTRVTAKCVRKGREEGGAYVHWIYHSKGVKHILVQKMRLRRFNVGCFSLRGGECFTESCIPVFSKKSWSWTQYERQGQAWRRAGMWRITKRETSQLSRWSAVRNCLEIIGNLKNACLLEMANTGEIIMIITPNGTRRDWEWTCRTQLKKTGWSS